MWDTLGNFSSKYDTVIDVHVETSPKSLMDTVKAHIAMDWSQNDVRFSYMVALCPLPIVISDDAELLFYLRLKSYQNNISYLPLCMEVLPTVTAGDVSAQDISSYPPLPVSNTGYTPHTMVCTANLTGQSNPNNLQSSTSNVKSDSSKNMKQTKRTKRNAKSVDVLSHYHPTTLQLDSIYKSKEDLCHHLQMFDSYHSCPVDFREEDKDSWLWFLTQLKTTLTPRHDLYIVSDRHEGILHAVQNIFPNAGHGFCTEHITRNLRGKFKGPKEDLTWKFRKASRAPTEVECEEYLKMLDEQDQRIRSYLSQIGESRWACCKSGPFRYSVMTSNAAESMNNVNNSAREYPICKLVDFIRERMQKWFHDRFETASSTSTILPKKLESELITLQRDAFKMKVKPSCPYEFEIVDRWTRSYVVNLRDKSCTCGEFQLDHFVCVHVVAAIGTRPGLSCYNFISPYYKREALVATYSDIVHPLGDKSSWDILTNVKSLLCKPPSCTKRPPWKAKEEEATVCG
ncbi:unnamed protein product [Cuscuta campestris]|uniref:SWIM-type domain-containing protein n=1 Tax=Cuscuta campestris TaxID=132261 RepID=A0A484K376_9ASTE|nr:unnamed protein product [Cuscuta campestris]